jgi:hypothetical protein
MNQLIAILVVGVLAASNSVADQYKIRLDRPGKVSQKYRLTAIGEQSTVTSVTVADKVVHQQTISVKGKLSGIVTVMEVNEKGESTRLKLSVVKLLRSSADSPQDRDMLPKGTEVIVEYQEGEEVCLINNATARREVREILAMLISLGQSSTSDDEVLGTDELRTVGDVWGINKAKAVQDFKSQDIAIAEDNISGEVTVKGIDTVNGVECLELTGTIEAREIGVRLPPGIALTEAAMTVEFLGKFPTDLTTGRLVERASMAMTMVMVRPATEETSAATTTVKIAQTSKKKRQYVE